MMSHDDVRFHPRILTGRHWLCRSGTSQNFFSQRHRSDKLPDASRRCNRGKFSMNHQETYRHNGAYAEFLANWDANFYAKYADTLKPAVRGAKVLDVGCGVGQVVARLAEQGFAAYGVDVSEPNIQRAQKVSDRWRLYDGKKLPFSNEYFASVRALNVRENVEEPKASIEELVRIVERGSKVALA